MAKKENPQYSFLNVAHETETIRCVEPYAFDYTTFAKGRWLKRPLIDVVTKEFGGYEESYWKGAISSGRVTVNNEQTSAEYVIRNGDRIVHRTHRHEPPVKGTIKLVGETDDLLAVCKPASMPMHPCGGYRYNSLSFLLAQEPLTPSQPVLHGVHRLDRVTSGLVINAKNKKAAAAVSKEIRENSTQKTYLARVKGRLGASLGHLAALEDTYLFASTESEEVQVAMLRGEEDKKEDKKEEKARTSGAATDLPDPPTKKMKTAQRQEPLAAGSEAAAGSLLVPGGTCVPAERIGYGWREVSLGADSSSGSGSGSGSGSEEKTLELVVRCPLGVASFKDGIHRCDINGKPALSTFRVVSYNTEDDTSVVLCRPHTGRTHQLRLHLQLIGNPIANDPCYGGELFFGEPLKIARAREAARLLLLRGGRTVSKLPHLLQLLTPEEEERSGGDEKSEYKSGACDEKKKCEVEGLNRRPDESEESFLIRNCRYCQANSCPDMADEMLLHCDGIWLHALRYCGRNWQFETQFPSWAQAS